MEILFILGIIGAAIVGGICGAMIIAGIIFKWFTNGWQ